MQARLVSLRFTDVVVLQIEGQTLHQQKDGKSRYSYTRFTAVAWSHTQTSEVCLWGGIHLQELSQIPTVSA